jgi:DNA-binding MarR family transcriptional regulator
MMNKYSAEEKIIQLIARINIKTRKLSELALRPIGLTLPQFGTLHALQEHKGVSQRELATVMEVDTTTVMVVCDSLEKKGYLRRIQDPSDRRINRLEVTEKGYECIKMALPLIASVFDPLVSSFTEDETASVCPVLEKLYRLVCTMEERR